MSLAFVILAAGSGKRLGGKTKQFRTLANRQVWEWSYDTAKTLKESRRVSEIALVLPQGAASNEVTEIPKDIITLHGGATRSLSVLEALKACTSDIVLLHDAARPFVSPCLCTRIIDKCDGKNAVIPILQETNALKKIKGGKVTAVNRDGIYITQTPQLFPRKKLLDMLYRSSDFDFKDEAELWLKNGEKLDYVEGDSMNFKLTVEGDWQMATRLADTLESRSGLGYDVHPLVPGRKFILGGVEIPSPLGLDGHSDADVLCHAIADAVLSAAGLPDIGTLYPASDEKFKGANSKLLLSDVLERVRKEGWHVSWISAVVSAQTPRLAPYHKRILDSLSEVFGSYITSVTFKSGERVQPAGYSEAVFVWANATLQRKA